MVMRGLCRMRIWISRGLRVVRIIRIVVISEVCCYIGVVVVNSVMWWLDIGSVVVIWYYKINNTRWTGYNIFK